MSAVAVVRMERYVTAFVAYEILVVRRQKMHTATAEAPCTAVLMEVQVHFLAAFQNELRAQGSHGFAAFDKPQAAPPGKVFYGGGAMAAEILPGQQRQGLFAWERTGRRQFIGYQSAGSP
jgi:hypothetical protein